MDYSSRFVPADGIYLLNHSVGRPSVDMQDHLRHSFLAPWQAGAGEPWVQWLAVIDEFCQQLAQLFNADAASFCPQTNLSGGLTKLLQALPQRPDRPVLLLCEEDFPSMGFVLQQARGAGQQLRFIPRHEDVSDLAVWDRYLDDQVALVLVSHVQSNNGRQLPVSEILPLARARGAISVVDVAQSAGVLPIDLGAWNADFVLGSCVKWLCGGPGAGYLWVNDGVLQQCEPRDVGWFSHTDPFEFDIRNFEYHSAARRFWGGTPSVAPYAIATAGIRTIADIGVDAIRAHNLSLSGQLIDAAGEQALRCPAEDELRSGTVVLDFGDKMATVCDALKNASVHFDRREQGLRLSPHIYNSAEEMSEVIQCLP